METFEPISNFEDALKIEEERKKERLREPEKYHPHVFYQELANYEVQIKRFLDCFGTEHVKIILLEEFIKNPKKIYLDVHNFLGLDYLDTFDFSQHNANRIPRSRILQKIMKNDSSIIMRIVKKLPNIGKLYTAINLPEQERIRLDPILRKKLSDDFQPKIKKLSELLKMDLSIWNN
jgi:hypothetical protein